MSRGHLRIYLGAAPGVGKTFAMLNEGWRRHERGTDVVVGFVEAHGRANTQAQVRDLEVVPRRRIDHRGATFEEMDLDAVLARQPAVALVDELAHTNVPGSRNEKRWEDVHELLDAGIDVISTVNIQHLESVNDVVERITGVKQRETVPDAVVREADQVELIDMTPEALRRRMAHGNIYASDKVDAALGNYFRVGNLAALRELALLWVADKVDDALHDYMVDHDIDHVWETRERVVVAMTGAPSGEHLIRRAARMAQRGHGDLIGVHIRSSDGLASGPNALLERHRQLLADLGGEYHEAVGTEVADTMLQFARRENATQLVLGASQRSWWAELVRGSVINRVIRNAGEIDVHVISDAEGEPEIVELLPRLPRPRHRPQLSHRRQLAGWSLLAIGLPVATVLLASVRADLSLSTVMLLYLLLVCVVAAVGGTRPAVVGAIAASLAVNYYFTPPIHTWDIAHGENVVALGIFIAVAILVSVFVTQAAARRLEAQRARAEAEALARVAGGLAGESDPVGEVLIHLRSTFEIESAAVMSRNPDGRGWRITSAVGTALPRSPDDGETVHLDADHVLVLTPAGLSADDRRVLAAFASQLSAALEQRELRERAAVAEAREEADQLRTAILRAVSHDLRTPLSGIKASATSLLADDVEWSAEDRRQFVEAIDQEADRLDRLVGNLLDMSRIESGALEVATRPVGLDEVVGLALDSLSLPTDEVEVDVPDDLPPVSADGALLERTIANLVGNALTHVPAGTGVRIEGSRVGEVVVLRVVDHGPGIAPDDRERVLAPFQRLGDGRTTTGVGLGLAVARGFVRAMGGTLLLDDTPGGGLTATIELRPAAPAGATAPPLEARS